MNIHPKIREFLPLFTAAGFNISSYGGSPDNGPARSVTLSKSVATPGITGGASSVPMSVDLCISADDRVTARINGLLRGYITVGSPTFSLPNSNAERWLSAVEQVSVAGAYEVAGEFDRGYFPCLLAAVQQHLESGRTTLAKNLIAQATQGLAA